MRHLETQSAQRLDNRFEKPLGIVPAGSKLIQGIPELETQERFSISVGKLGQVFGTEELFELRKIVATLRCGAERVVDGKHEAINADDVEGALQWRPGEVAAGCQVDVRPEVSSHGLTELRDVRERAGGADQGHGQHLAHVTDHELQSGETIKDTGGD